ncbi:hypothetical protein [Corynebacterium cystitidis]|uniref:hypothetical protein n=1 Tax=Corynebacterium cystitidis TaxID=35757 RepID=UPI00211F2037|nr:hypothetical protein [Corynebacterium cystitidis]
MSTSITPAKPRHILPAPVFVLGYGVLLISAVVLIVLLVNHEASSEATPQPKEKKNSAGPTFETDPQATLGLVHPWLIDEASAAPAQNGLRLEGVLTEAADANPTALAIHIDQLLMSTCLTNLALETQDNMQLDFWGFCYSSMPPEQLEKLITDARVTGADSLAILDFPGSNHDKEVFYTWFADTDREQAEIEKKWTVITGDKDIELISLSLYGPDSIQVVDFEEGGKPTRKKSPANEAFDQRWAR